MRELMAGQVFFDRKGTFRNVPYCVLAVVFCSVGLWLLSKLGEAFLQQQLNAENWFGAIGVFWIAVPLAPGLYLAYRIAFRPDWISRIDELGITADSRFWPWQEIAWVFAKVSGNGWSICFQVKHGLIDRDVFGPPLLSEDDAGELLQDLEEFLADRFLDVSVN